MGLFDVHAHLTHPTLADRVDEILATATAAGVTSILSNGLNPSDNEAVRALAARAPIVKACFGLYPVDAVLLEMERLNPRTPAEVADQEETRAFLEGGGEPQPSEPGAPVDPEPK